MTTCYVQFKNGVWGVFVAYLLSTFFCFFGLTDLLKFVQSELDRKQRSCCFIVDICFCFPNKINLSTLFHFGTTRAARIDQTARLLPRWGFCRQINKVIFMVDVNLKCLSSKPELPIWQVWMALWTTYVSRSFVQARFVCRESIGILFIIWFYTCHS